MIMKNGTKTDLKRKKTKNANSEKGKPNNDTSEKESLNNYNSGK